MIKSKLLLALFLITTIISCPDKDEKCGSCNHSTCDYCYDSYIGQDGKCVDSTITIENCLTYLKDATCKQCVFDFHLVQNKCEKIEIDDCLRVNTKNECIVCKDKSTIVDGKCVKSNLCNLKNCRHCGFENGVEVCIFCDKGFSIFPIDANTQCKANNIEGCLSLNFFDESKCSLCKAHFYFSNGKCVKSTAYDINMEKLDMLFTIYTLLISIIYLI